jgi:peptide/nickel transport system ATP-binding protein
LQDQLGLSYLFISHDLNVVGYLCSEVAVMYKGTIVEYAPTDALFDSPHHPYTNLLLSAAPDAEMEAPPSVANLEAEAPPTLSQTAGCRFGPKCALLEARCQDEELEFVRVGEHHYVRCWKTAGGNTLKGPGFDATP